jgi:hypothetical protein
VITIGSGGGATAGAAGTGMPAWSAINAALALPDSFASIVFDGVNDAMYAVILALVSNLAVTRCHQKEPQSINAGTSSSYLYPKMS